MRKIFNWLGLNGISIFYKIVYLAVLKMPFIQLYQPVFGSNTRKELTRPCSDRWDVIAPQLPKTKGSVLDIGCNIGYFSFKCAEMGQLAVGIDYHRYNILICSAIAHKNDVKNVHFIRQFTNPDFVELLPCFNTIINLSVFHHWVKQFGKDRAFEMMRTLSGKCERLVFETGQSDEIGSQWPEILSFMGSKPEVWIETFLREIGFSEVVSLGKFSTGLTSAKRTMFLASKEQYKGKLNPLQ